MGVIKLGSFGAGAVVIEADFHDGNRRVTRARVINNGTGACRVTLLDPADNSIVAQATFPAGQTTQLNVAGQQVVTTSEGVDLPYHTSIQYPA